MTPPLSSRTRDWAAACAISAGVAISRLHIVPRLPLFLEQHPDLSLDLLLSDRIGDPVEEGVDICLRTGVLDDSSMIARRIAAGRRLAVGTPAFFERCGLPETPDELARLPAVIYTMERAGGEAHGFRCGEAQIRHPAVGAIACRCRRGGARRCPGRERLCGGLGVDVRPGTRLGDGARALLTDWRLAPLDLWALFPTGRMVTAKARAFANFVEAVFRGLPDGLHSRGE